MSGLTSQAVDKGLDVRPHPRQTLQHHDLDALLRVGVMGLDEAPESHHGADQLEKDAGDRQDRRQSLPSSVCVSVHPKLGTLIGGQGSGAYHAPIMQPPLGRLPCTRGVRLANQLYD